MFREWKTILLGSTNHTARSLLDTWTRRGKIWCSEGAGFHRLFPTHQLPELIRLLTRSSWKICLSSVRAFSLRNVTYTSMNAKHKLSNLRNNTGLCIFICADQLFMFVHVDLTELPWLTRQAMLPNPHCLLAQCFLREQKYHFLKIYISYIKLKKKMKFLYDIRIIFSYKYSVFNLPGEIRFYATLKSMEFY